MTSPPPGRLPHLVDGAAQLLVVSLRDLHDQQVFFDATSGCVAFLDLDTLAAAESAPDLGNLAGHVEVADAVGVERPGCASVSGALNSDWMR